MSKKSSLLQAIADRLLIGDGAMGTQLQLAGLEPGGCGEAWNLDRSEKVEAIQRSFVAAGSDCLLTNTFGASRIALERHGEGDRVRAINRASVQIARRAFDDRSGYVIGDIGPFGGLLEPYGETPHRLVAEAFLEQAEALVAAGADAIIIETQTALDELAIAVRAARRAGAPCVIGSVAFDALPDGDDFRTPMGASPEDAAALLVAEGADLLGLNCGCGIDVVAAAAIARRYRSACALPIMAQPNAGQPVLEGLRVVYRETPEQMAAGLPGLIEAGVAIAGACCGSTPDHVRLLRQALDELCRASAQK